MPEEKVQLLKEIYEHIILQYKLLEDANEKLSQKGSNLIGFIGVILGITVKLFLDRIDLLAKIDKYSLIFATTIITLLFISLICFLTGTKIRTFTSLITPSFLIGKFEEGVSREVFWTQFVKGANKAYEENKKISEKTKQVYFRRLSDFEDKKKGLRRDFGRQEKQKRFTFLMKDELSRKKPKNNHFSWSVNETKYLDIGRVGKLKKACQQAKDKAIRENKIVPVRDWFMVELGLFTGLRVEEMTNLKASDLHLKEEHLSLTVKKGKGDKPRTVYLPETFKKECLFYLVWKEKSIPKSDYLFTNSGGRQLTKRAMQKSFKKCLRLAGLESRYSIHCLRHTYGSFLYKSSNHDLRMVQEQLGHSSIRTTQVYAGLMNEDVKKAIDKIYQ